MKYRTVKKQMNRLYRATASLVACPSGTYFSTAKKIMTGKSARYLFGQHYDKAQWAFWGRPQFDIKAKYIFVDTGYGLSAFHADINHMYSPGWQD